MTVIKTRKGAGKVGQIALTDLGVEGSSALSPKLLSPTLLTSLLNTELKSHIAIVGIRIRIQSLIQQVTRGSSEGVIYTRNLKPRS
jgi:hypothetical protein